jgi:polar amino acid transport system substrate-binding protein
VQKPNCQCLSSIRSGLGIAIRAAISDRILKVFVLSALLCLAVAACDRREHTELVVGMELAYPPFEMTDARGAPAGLSVDLACALAESLGRKLVIENVPFAGLIPALKSGKIDLVISSMTATEERARSIDFSDPYLKTGLCLLVNARSDIRSIGEADQPGRAIAVKQGTTGHAYATERVKSARLLVLDKETACVLEVVQGKADAFIYDQMSTYEHWRRNPDTTRAILTPFQTESWAIGIRKGNDALRGQANQFLADFHARGGFEELGNRYLKQQQDAFKQMGIPFFF